MLFLKQPLICLFSAINQQPRVILTQRRSQTLKLKLDLCNWVKTEITESAAPPQLPHKRGTITLGHPVICCKRPCLSLKYANNGDTE